MRRSAWAALVLIVVVAAGIGGVWLLQQRLSGPELRQSLASAIERRTGRVATIGQARARLLPMPRLEVDDIVVGRPAPLPAPLRIGHLVATIGIWPLLRHVVRIDTLRLDHVVVELARDRAGRDNWEFRPGPARSRPGSGQAGGGHWWVELGSVAMHGAALSYHDAGSKRGGAMQIRTLTLSDLQGKHARLRLRGVSHGADYAVRGTIGELAGLLDGRGGGAGWPVSLRAVERIGPDMVGTARLSGTIAGSAHALDGTLLASVRLSDLAVLNRLFTHANLPSARSFEAAGRLSDAGHASFALIRASAGATVIPGAPGLALASWSLVGAAPGSAALRLAARGSWRGHAVEATGTVAPPTDRAIQITGLRLVTPAGELDGGLTLSPLGRSAGGDLALSSALLTIDGRAYPDVRLHAVLKDARRLAASAQARGVAARLSAEPGPSGPQTRLWMHPLIMPASLLQELLGRPPLLHGDVEMVGRLDAHGNGRDAIVASASGTLGLSMIDGRIANAALLSLVGHGSAVAALLPRHGETALRCLALHGTAGGGSLTLDTAALQADRLSLDGSGRIGLGDGGLDLHLLADASLGVASASLPLRVAGTIEDPRPSLAAAAPGGRFALTIQPGGTVQDLCAASLSRAREGLAGPLPEPVPHASRKAPKALDILRGLGFLH